MKRKCTTNATYNLRTVIERALEVQKDARYICASLPTPRRLTVRHDEIITQLTQMKIDGKDTRVIKNMYWEQSGAM